MPIMVAVVLLSPFGRQTNVSTGAAFLMSDLTDNLAALYVDEQGRLQRFLMRRGLSAAAAADLVQDAFLRMLRAPCGEVRDLRSYLFRTTGNLAIDDARQRRRAAPIVDAAVLDETVADTAPLPDAALISREELQALREALAELPPRCREVLILHKFEGLSYSEIADRLGIAKNTVTVHMVKAVSRLKCRFCEISSPSE